MGTLITEVRNIFNTKTRIGRLRFMSYTSLLILVPLIWWGIAVVLFLILKKDLYRYVGLVFAVMFLLYFAVAIVYEILLLVRRLHDFNYSGIWAIVTFIPLFGIPMFIYLLCAPGTKGPNNYGEAPPPNTVWNVVGACVYPVFFVVLYTMFMICSLRCNG